jgi:sugar lactone lactonase YvrE
MSDFRVIETGRRCRVGEGRYCSVRQQALYWVDILGQSVFRLRAKDGCVTTWQMPEMIGSLIGRVHADGFVAGIQGNCAYLNPEPLTITPVSRREANPGATD